MKNHDMANPIAGLEKLWRIGERIAVFTAVMIVSGTIGYVSLACTHIMQSCRAHMAPVFF